MIELDEIKYRLTPYEKELDEIKDALDLQNKEERIIELERTKIGRASCRERV